MTDKLKKMTLEEIELHVRAEIIRQMQIADVSIVSIRFDWLCADTSFNSLLVTAKIGGKDEWYNITYTDEKEFTIDNN